MSGLSKINFRYLMIIILLGAIVAIGAFSYSRLRVLGSSTDANQQIYGLILPHHDLASVMIISTISKLKTLQSDYKYIVVISPNHWQPLIGPFITASSLPDTTLADHEIASLVSKIPQITTDNDLISAEHGLMVPIKYLQAAYSQAKFFPLALSPSFSRSQIQQLATELIRLFPSDTLFVASSDFSHGHMLEQANTFDTQTVAAISSSDYPALYQFTDDNLDCPACVGLLLQIGQGQPLAKFELWQQSHGSLITGNPYNSGTSYITGVLWHDVDRDAPISP